MNAFKQFVGADDEAESNAFDEACKLSKKQRMIGFGCCFGFGMFISFLSCMMLMRPTSFALLYSTGNILSLLSTGFLIGFKRQAKGAFARKRVVATIIFLVSIVGTILAATMIKSWTALAVIPLIIIQFCALVWYTASYIPFARQAIASVVGSILRRGGSSGSG